MNGEHIEHLLDRRCQDLTESERQRIEEHIESCHDCLRKYRAAVVADSLITARANQSVEVPSFFSTRVMAAIREKRADKAFSFAASWKAARVLLASMVSLVTILAALTFFASRTRPQMDVSSYDDIYTTEWVIVNDADPTADVTDNQVLTTLYEPAEQNGPNN